MNKFEGAPSIRLISLYESEKRRAVMRSQFKKYGIKNYHFYLTDRYEKIRDNVKVNYFFGPETGGGIDWSFLHGSVIAHLENLRHWYVTTNEPYAIFMDDDIDLSTSEYWNFTIKEFIEGLPKDWEAVQLIRCQQYPGVVGPEAYDVHLKLYLGRWWGAAFLLSRDYAKKVIERHIRGPLHYDLRLLNKYTEPYEYDYLENVENIMLLNKATPLNFPLFTNLTRTETDSTYHGSSNTPSCYLSADTEKMWETTRVTFMDLWKSKGHEVDLKKDLVLPL